MLIWSLIMLVGVLWVLVILLVLWLVYCCVIGMYLEGWSFWLWILMLVWNLIWFFKLFLLGSFGIWWILVCRLIFICFGLLIIWVFGGGLIGLGWVKRNCWFFLGKVFINCFRRMCLFVYLLIIIICLFWIFISIIFL